MSCAGSAGSGEEGSSLVWRVAGVSDAGKLDGCAMVPLRWWRVAGVSDAGKLDGCAMVRPYSPVWNTTKQKSNILVRGREGGGM